MFRGVSAPRKKTGSQLPASATEQPDEEEERSPGAPRKSKEKLATLNTWFLGLSQALETDLTGLRELSADERSRRVTAMARYSMEVLQEGEFSHFLQALLASAIERQRRSREEASSKAQSQLPRAAPRTPAREQLKRAAQASREQLEEQERAREASKPAAASEPPREYLVDRAPLEACLGLRFVTLGGETLDDVAEWGKVMSGEMVGERLRVGSHYLPACLNGCPVLTPLEDGGFKVEDRWLRQARGLRYSFERGGEEEDTKAGMASWGSVVEGHADGERCIRVGCRFLPRTLNGAPVLNADTERRTPESTRRAPLSPQSSETSDRVLRICKEMQEMRQVVVDGHINSDNIRWFVAEVMETRSQALHWETSWAQLCIPKEHLRSAGMELLRGLLEWMRLVPKPSERIRPASEAIAHLSRGHHIKLSTTLEVLEECMPAVLKRCPKAWQLLSWLLFHWFPRPKGHSWGWSRIGWSFVEWWKLVDKLLQLLPQEQHTFDALRCALAFMEEHEGGRGLHRQELWSEPRLAALRGKMRRQLGISKEGRSADVELKARLKGLQVWGAAEQDELWCNGGPAKRARVEKGDA